MPQPLPWQRKFPELLQKKAKPTAKDRLPSIGKPARRSQSVEPVVERHEEFLVSSNKTWTIVTLSLQFSHDYRKELLETSLTGATAALLASLHECPAAYLYLSIVVLIKLLITLFQIQKMIRLSLSDARIGPYSIISFY